MQQTMLMRLYQMLELWKKEFDQKKGDPEALVVTLGKEAKVNERVIHDHIVKTGEHIAEFEFHEVLSFKRRSLIAFLIKNGARVVSDILNSVQKTATSSRNKPSMASDAMDAVQEALTFNAVKD
eukprot:gene17603-biopygen92037